MPAARLISKKSQRAKGLAAERPNHGHCTLRLMSTNNAITSAWSALAALCLPVGELKPNQSEMRLTAGECTIIVTRGHNEISAVMHEPNGRILERKFSVEGSIDYPILVEGADATRKRVSEVFEELMAWVREPACEA